MSAPSHYTINVSRLSDNSNIGRYVHLFSTDITGRYEYQKVASEIRGRFPSPEFKVTATYWECTGHEM